MKQNKRSFFERLKKIEKKDENGKNRKELK